MEKPLQQEHFLDDSDANYIWVSIESKESSPQYLWDSLTRQMAKTIPELGNQLRALGYPEDAPQREKILRIIEDYTYLTNTVFVIDDYHLSQSLEFDKLLVRIIRLRIDGLHILLLLRTIPDMHIDELILKGHCYNIKSNLFEASSEEIKKYFNYNLKEFPHPLQVGDEFCTLTGYRTYVIIII